MLNHLNAPDPELNAPDPELNAPDPELNAPDPEPEAHICSFYHPKNALGLALVYRMLLQRIEYVFPKFYANSEEPFLDFDEAFKSRLREIFNSNPSDIMDSSALKQFALNWLPNLERIRGHYQRCAVELCGKLMTLTLQQIQDEMDGVYKRNNLNNISNPSFFMREALENSLRSKKHELSLRHTEDLARSVMILSIAISIMEIVDMELKVLDAFFNFSDKVKLRGEAERKLDEWIIAGVDQKEWEILKLQELREEQKKEKNYDQPNKGNSPEDLNEKRLGIFPNPTKSAHESKNNKDKHLELYSSKKKVEEIKDEEDFTEGVDEGEMQKPPQLDFVKKNDLKKNGHLELDSFKEKLGEMKGGVNFIVKVHYPQSINNPMSDELSNECEETVKVPKKIQNPKNHL